MLNIALFGPPGAGKGTQSQWLIPHLKLVHVAPGDILREHISLQTDLGKKVQPFIEKGELVPNELVISAVTEKIQAHPDAKGFLFDGYPRTCLQAETLDKQLAAQQRTLDFVIFLQVRLQESYQRIKKRSKELFRVDDQSDEKIATRFEYYHKRTLPVTEYYKQQAKLVHIPGEYEIPKVRHYINKHVQDYLVSNS